MKKNIALFTIFWILLSFTQSEMNGYISLFENSSSAKYYKYGKTHYFEFFDNKKEPINGKEYYIRYRKYGWGTTDTTYYRKGKEYYYHIDKKTLVESILLPIKPELGNKWLDADESWSYEVIATKQKFRTPKKKYANCIKVHCKQLTDRDSKKSKEYFLFYSPKYGYVGNVNHKGKVLSYLSELKLNAKEGDKIGGK